MHLVGYFYETYVLRDVTLRVFYWDLTWPLMICA